MSNPFIRRLLATATLCTVATGSQAAFTINLTFSGLSATQQSYFTAAKSFWEGVITGYQTGITLSGFTVSATGANIDGVGGVLGSAGPTSGVSQGGYVLTTAGAMSFDTADINQLISQGSFTDVIKHEMAHVIGLGTWWNANNLTVNGSGRYTGANALAAYRTEFNQATAQFVPVELGGGQGTANGHWNEVDNGAGATGITDNAGRDFRDELMTGWLNAPTFVSDTTVASFIDLGYTVNLVTAVPEPGTWLLWLLGAPALAGATLRSRRETTRS